jgi:hypothetical protein
MMYLRKLGYGPSNICLSGGSSSSSGSTTPQATPKQMAAIYNQYLPSVLATTSNQNAPVTNSMADAAANANPIYTASGLNQLNSYAPGYANAGNNLTQQQSLGAYDNLTGAGGLSALAGAGLTNLLNPAQAANNTQATNLVNSINLNGLSGGEQAAAERSLNQSNYATGNMGLDNATNAVSNAMNFGQQLQAKRAALGSALSTAQGVATGQNTAFNPTQYIAQSSNTGNNYGLSQFNPTQANSTLSTPYSFSSSFGNQLAGVGAASAGTTTSGGASGGCFLTTAACEYKGLPDDCELLKTLRKFRDEKVPKDLVDKYYRISPSIAQKVRGDEKQLEYVYSTAKKCESLINEGKSNQAITEYELMVTNLSRLYV